MTISPPSADLLLKQFIRLAQDLTDAATPQDNILPVLASDKRYQCALQGVKLLAHHSVGALVQALINWRTLVNDDIKRNYSQGSSSSLTIHGVAKRAAMEVLFLETSIAILDAFVPDFWREPHFQSFFVSMQHVAFRWLLGAEDFVKESELQLVRQHLVATSVRIIGAMSRVRLADITSQFIKRLEEKVNPPGAARSGGPLSSVGAASRADPGLMRTQVLRLCSGMRKIVLCFDDDTQLAQSTAFLRSSHPLSFNATVKKSQVHHALCEMLIDILTPLIRSNVPHGFMGMQRARLSPALLDDWFKLILQLKDEIGAWSNKHSKHIPVGYPLVTVLVCLVNDANYPRFLDAMADFLVKQMKVKDHRSLCFKCLSQLIVSFMVRNGACNTQQPTHVAWLDRMTKPILANARKGGISSQEQQEFISEVADLNPQYALANIIMDLLQSDAPDAQAVALKALYQMVTSVPAAKAAAMSASSAAVMGAGRVGGASGSFDRSARSSGSGSAARRMVQVGPQQALDLIRRNQHPLDLQGAGHVLPKVTAVLARMLASFHSTYGGAYSWGSGEQLGRSSERQKEQLGLLSGLVRLLPFLKPQAWPNMRPLELLPAYSAHAEGTVRACAYDALLSSVRAVPALRNTIITRVAAFLVTIPDEAVQAARECLLLLQNLIELWRTLLAERPASASSCDPPAAPGTAPSSAANSSSSSSSSTTFSPQSEPRTLSLHQIEGVLFVLLCSADESIRQDAYKLLKTVRALHEALQALDACASAAAAPAAVPAGAAAARVGNTSFASMDAGELAGPGVAGSWEPGAARHAPSASRESVEWSGSYTLEAPAVQQQRGLEEQAPVVYVMDVIEEVGRDATVRCYWDFGDWSDLWREFKPVPPDASFESAMVVRDEVSKLRWLRCIAELAREAAHMCPASMAVAMQEVMIKLGRVMPRDPYAGRVLIPEHDVRRSEAWKAFVAVACVLPPNLPKEAGIEAVTGTVSARKAQAPTPRELIRALIASLAGAAATGAQQPALHTQVCLMALGHCAPEHYGTLFEELPALVEEYAPKHGGAGGRKRQQAGRPDEMRKLVANILRIVGDAMPLHTLAQQPAMRARYCDFIRDTYTYLRAIAPFSETFWEVSQVAYSLCSVARAVGTQLVSQLTLPMALLRDSSSATSTASSAAAAAAAAGGGASPLAFQRNISIKSSEPGTPGTATGSGALLAARSVEFGSGMPSQPPARKLLFELFAQWSEEGIGAGAEYAARLNGGINQSLAQLRDLHPEAREGLKTELASSAELLDHAARGAMAAMLRGPAFDTDARRPTGPVLSWIDRLLRQQGQVRRNNSTLHHLAASSNAYGSFSAGGGRMGPPKDAVARTAMGNLLRSNLDMFGVAVDRCYDPDLSVATGYFQVVCEVYSLHALMCEPHVLLSLVLYKMVDASAEVREDALHVLHILSMREWQAPSAADNLPAPQPGTAASEGAAAAGTAAGAAQGGQLEGDGSGAGAVVVLGNLQDSYQQFQYQLSAKLARDHPELSEALCEEMMTRQLECNDKVVQHPVLTCLAPWMENLSIAAHWKGTWCERLLKSMYYVTLRHGSELPLEIERLWSTLAAHKRNIIPVLDFLVTLGMHVAYQELGALMEFFAVGKRIALYLARISPQQTIDHLAYETSLALLEEDPSNGSNSGTHGSNSSGFGPGGGGGWRGVSVGGGVMEVPLEFTAALRDSGAGSTSMGRADSALLPGRFPAASLLDMRASAGAADMPFLARASGSASVSASAPDLRDHIMLSRQITQTSDADGGRALMASASMSRAHVGGLSVGPSEPSVGAGPRISAISVGARTTEDAVGGSGLSAIPSGMGNGLYSTSSGNVPGRYSYGVAGLAAGGNGDGSVLGVAASRRATGAAVGGAAEPTSPSLRGLVSRPELALCLLSEVAYEHDEDFVGHLSLLFHVGVCCLDAEEPLVAQHAQQLLVHLLYSLSARHLEVEQDAGRVVECREATSLIQYLQSMKGRRLWAYEDLSLKRTTLPSAQALSALVEHVRAAMFFEAELADGWAETALDWSLHARSRHVACRSHQVLRALRPPLTADVAATLLVCLQQCCALARGSSVARDCIVEVVLTLQALVAAMASGKLVLYPQVFWAALSLLLTDYVHVYQHALGLLSLCMQQLQLSDAMTRHVLLASAPLADEAALSAALAGLPSHAHAGNGKGWGSDPDNAPQLWAIGQLLPWQDESAVDGGGSPGMQGGVQPGVQAGVQGSKQPAAAQQLIAVQQLLWKGLLFPETQLGAVQVLAQLAAQLALAGVPAHAAAPLNAALRAEASATSSNHNTVGGPSVAGSGASSLRSSGVGALAGAIGGGKPPAMPQTARGAYAGGEGSRGTGGSGTEPSSSSTSLSKSAPELRGIAARAARAAHLNTATADHVAGPGPGSAASSATATPRTPGRSGQQQPGSVRAASPGVSGAAAAAATAAAAAAAAMGSAAYNSRRRGGTYGSSGAGQGLAVYEALLGTVHAQLLCSIVCVVPVVCAQAESGVAGDELSGALQDCMQALCAACQAQGLPELGARLAALTQHPSSTQQTQQQPAPPASPTPGPQTAQLAPTATAATAAAAAGNACSPSPLSLLPALALQIARAFLPRHAPWLLCKCVAVLAMPGARALHESVLALLTALFRVPGLKLGPQATAMVAGSELFTPLVALAQGPLCKQALESLDAIISFCSASREVQQYRMELAAGAVQAPNPSEVDHVQLLAGCLPQLHLPTVIGRVLSSCSASPTKRRRQRLMPFLSGGSLLHEHARATDD